ncbi:hypothetical protein [Janibacter sp. DB-40]|uniref:hypothetical protein n=1 Tax=Janibacter sp. DB-40 TaxID=3028808 RepID=UPI002406A1B8|nr:hypothetical protein [Janibacter sp. DB-40]
MSATSQQTVPEQFLGFFDDAATFPPGLAPVEQAVTDHVARRSSPFVPAVGPAVLALADLQRAREVADALDLSGGPVEVSVVTPAGALTEALEAVEDVRPQLEVVAIELKTDPQDRAVMAEQIADAAAVQGIPVFVELTAAQVADGALNLLVGTGLALKYRTGGIEAHLFPTPQELGDVLARAVAAGLPFKLTAGLHEAVRYTNDATGFHHHGFLNIALATQAARDGEPAESIAAWLAQTDPDVLGTAAAASDGAWRESFRSFGTCSVDEPADSLRRLDLFPTLTTNQEHP